MTSDASKTKLVAFSQMLGDLALAGELSGMVVITVGPGNASQVHFLEMNAYQALGLVHISNVSLVNMIQKGNA